MDEETRKNFIQLLAVCNVIRHAYGKPMYVNSGLRSQADQARINPSAPKSKHLLGQAVDFRDNDGKLWKWFMDNMDLCEKLGVYFEDKASTPTWCHLQTVPPKSGKRIFKP